VEQDSEGQTEWYHFVKEKAEIIKNKKAGVMRRRKKKKKKMKTLGVKNGHVPYVIERL
jgi:hypothetical protein